MSRYIKLFDTHAQYEAFTASTEFIKPNVSACLEENEAHFNPSLGPYAGHDYVEIGGLKWATMNIGATAVTDTGLYFQWGDISGYTASQVGSGSGQKAFNCSDYKFSNNGDCSSSAMTKYNNTDSLFNLEESDDAAVVNWGGRWRMPTTQEFSTFGNAVNTAWTSNYNDSGIAGLICTDKTDSSKELFFPAVGLCLNGNVNSVNVNGFYLSKTRNASVASSCYDLYIRSEGATWNDGSSRYNGFAIRPVAN